MKRALLLLRLICISLALASCTTTGGGKSSGDTATGEWSPGIFGRISAALPSLPSLPSLPFGKPNTDKPLLDAVKGGRYEASSLALGEEKDLARNRGDGLGFVRADSIEQHLGAIRKKLELVTLVSDIPGKVVVLANPAYAAHATADGNIYVSMAWLIHLENEDEMAAIIAHELAHVLLLHHSSELLSRFQKQAQSFHELGVAAKMVLLQVSTVSQKDQRGFLAGQLIADVGDKLIMPAWGRKQEREADLLGVDLLAKAGYAPDAMITMLEKLRAWEVQNKESDEAFWKRVRDMALTDIQQTAKTMFSRFTEQFTASHPDTSERLADVTAYLEQHHGETVGKDPNATEWQRFQERPLVKSLVRNYDAAFQARKTFDAGKSKEAYELARKSVEGPTAMHAYPNWVLAISADRLNLQAEASAALERAIKSPEPVREIYDRLIDVRERRGQLEPALQLADMAAATFGDSEYWMPIKIRLLRKLNRTTEATALMAECMVKAPERRRACQEANSGTIAAAPADQSKATRSTAAPAATPPKLPMRPPAR